MNLDPQNDLERALVLAAKDPAARPAFIRKPVESLQITNAFQKPR
jgi:hypothetical protein